MESDAQIGWNNWVRCGNIATLLLGELGGGGGGPISKKCCLEINLHHVSKDRKDI